MAEHKPLKLLATDTDDLAILSAMLQDALVPVDDMTWRREQGQFVLVANRFRRETAPDHDRKGAIHQRVHSGLCVDNVQHVRRRGFGRGQPLGYLSLLAIRHEARPDGGHALDLTFSGGAEIRLEIARVSCRLEDVDQPWPTRLEPTHDPSPPDR